MSTNPIPAGTCNFPVNMPKPMRAALGRFSTLHGFRSVGAWIRGVLSLEVTGWRSHVQSGAAGICAMNDEGERLFAAIAADGQITPEELEVFRSYQRRERAADESHSAIAHLEPVESSAAELAEARAEMERVTGGMLPATEVVS